MRRVANVQPAQARGGRTTSTTSKEKECMRDRAKQLMELLLGERNETAAIPLELGPAALDFEATEFLNPEPGALAALVLEPDLDGRQLIIERAGAGKRGHRPYSVPWRLWGEVSCWSVQVIITGKTPPARSRWLRCGAPGFGLPEPDPVGRISERYSPFGARRECPDIVRFTRVGLATGFTADLRALLAEHGVGARFRTSLNARTVRGEKYRWDRTRQRTLEPIGQTDGEPWWSRDRAKTPEGGEG